MHAYDLRRGVWRKLPQRGGDERPGPTSCHAAFALPPTAAARASARGARDAFGALRLCCVARGGALADATAAEVSAAHVIWSFLEPRGRGRMLVVLRSDETRRGDPDPEHVVFEYDMRDTTWRALSRECDAPFGLIDACSHVGLVHAPAWGATHRLLVHGQLSMSETDREEYRILRSKDSTVVCATLA